MAEEVHTAAPRADGGEGRHRGDRLAAPPVRAAEQAAIDEQRWEILQRLECWLETPMVVLGVVWLALLVAELVWGLSPLLRGIANLIWMIFGVDFAISFFLAPKKLAFLKGNWLIALSLFVPALRTLRLVQAISFLRALPAARGLTLLRLVASVNRGMQALGATMGRRGVGYVVALTAVVLLVGAAGMYAFERNLPSGGLDNYGAALWFTIMLMTTIGSDYWPKTPEGRVLCILLSVYAIGVFGYIAATLASFFVDRDAESQHGEIAGEKSVAALREEVAALHAEIHALVAQLQEGGRANEAPARTAERRAA